MASPSSSCEIVDLALAATRDDASSRLFFSGGGGGGGGGGGDLSWPVAAAIPSALTNQESLVTLCRKYGVPRELKPVCAAALGCGACEAPPEGSNALCIYAGALEAGLRFPLHDFYLKLLRHYRLAPSQLGPSAWRYMAAFVLRCKDAGVEPLVSAFRYFFSIYTHRHQDKPLGWHFFQPCGAGRRLFTVTGTLPKKRGWKSRFFFLESPKGMPWKCPVAWGKPRMEEARTVELTDAAINKLKQMPCVDLKHFLSLHAPPVGDLTLLQLHSKAIIKPESAAASAQALLHQLHAVLEAGARATSAAGEGDDLARRKRGSPGPGPASVTVTPPMPQSFAVSASDDSTRWRRRCAGPVPASVTVTPPMPQTFAISAAPPLPPQGMETMQCETSFDGIWGNGEISLPPGIWPGDALSMYDAMVAIDAEKARSQDKEQAIDAKAAQQIAQLQGQLQQANAENAKFRAENAVLKEKYASEIAKLNPDHASEVSQITMLKEKHASEIAKLNEEHASEVTKLKEEHASAVAWLKEELEVEVARVKHTAEEVAVDMVQDAKKDMVLFLFPDLDTSLL